MIDSFESTKTAPMKAESIPQDRSQPVGIGVDGVRQCLLRLATAGTSSVSMGSNHTEISGNTEGFYGEPIPKSGMAVDPVSGDVFATVDGSTSRSSHSTPLERSFKTTGLRARQTASQPRRTSAQPKCRARAGLAVDPSNGDVYVDERDQAPSLRPPPGN